MRGPGLCSCGGGGIRTHDTRKRMLVFKTSAFSQALPPLLRNAAASLEVTAASRPAPKLQLSQVSVKEEIVNKNDFQKTSDLAISRLSGCRQQLDPQFESGRRTDQQKEIWIQIVVRVFRRSSLRRPVGIPLALMDRKPSA